MKQRDYFVDGGTLPPEAPSYVPRSADEELLKRTRESQFSYVLTARQMGKSSLMIRTANALRRDGIKAAIVDLTIIGTQVSLDQWYLGLLSQIKTELKLRADIQRLWRDLAHLGPLQRFSDFLRKIVLEEIAGNVAIFIDEIDSTLSLSFRDDFFAAIRAVYNARASDPVYNRLTFVLLGVAAPTDLIGDPKRTPFNIGERIILQGFRLETAGQLREGLRSFYPGQEEKILRRVFYWTNGHPYLTQRLCRMMLEVQVSIWNDTAVDALVNRLFLTDEARRDPNLTFVRDRVRAASPAERTPMLKLYRQIIQGQHVPDDDRERPNLYLKLYGLVAVEEGRLTVNNRIYEHVFNDSWIDEYLGGQTGGAAGEQRRPFDPRLIYAMVGIVVLLVIIGILLWQVMGG